MAKIKIRTYFVVFNMNFISKVWQIAIDNRLFECNKSGRAIVIFLAIIVCTYFSNKRSRRLQKYFVCVNLIKFRYILIMSEIHKTQILLTLYNTSLLFSELSNSEKKK